MFFIRVPTVRYLLTCYFNPAFHAAVLSTSALLCIPYRAYSPGFHNYFRATWKKTPFTSLKACLCAKNTMKREKERAREKERDSVIQNKIILSKNYNFIKYVIWNWKNITMNWLKKYYYLPVIVKIHQILSISDCL